MKSQNQFVCKSTIQKLLLHLSALAYTSVFSVNSIWSKSIISLSLTKSSGSPQECIAKSIAEHGYTPSVTDLQEAVNEQFPKNWTASLDDLTSADDNEESIGDKSSVLANAWYAMQEDEESLSLRNWIAWYPHGSTAGRKSTAEFFLARK